MSNQRGSVLVLTTLFSLVLLGFAALAVDAGRTVATRTRLQRVADAAALAGCKDLPISQAKAATSALDFANRNGIALTGGDVSFPTATSVRVQVSRPVTTVFARVFGIASYTIPAAATAATRGAQSTVGLRPWGITSRYFDTYKNGGTFKLKLDSKDPEYAGGGNYQALALDGNGANSYRDTIVNGSQTRYAINDPVTTKPGNMGNNTGKALDELIGADTHSSYAAAVLAGETHCPRLVTVIIISESDFGNGRNALHIAGFATCFITSYGKDTVDAEFVRYADINATSDGHAAGLGTQAIALIN
jgi:Flp pilus assembly protein TadG